MMTEADELRAWLFAKRSKALLLAALLREPDRGWSRKDLAEVAEQHEKARMDRHLTPLLKAHLLVRTGDVYRLRQDSPFVEPLRVLLNELGIKT